MTKLPRNERKSKKSNLAVTDPQKPQHALAGTPARNMRGVVRNEEGLLPKWALYVEEYMIDLTQKAAAIRAGYSPASAASIAAELMSKDEVIIAIERRMGERLKRLRLEQDAVMEELAVIAHSDVRHYTLGHDGRLGLRDGVPGRAARAVSSFKTKRKTYIDDNEKEVTVEEQEIRLWDKPAAIRLFMQHAGMLIERQGVVDKAGNLTDPVPALTIQSLRLILSGKAQQQGGLKEIAEAMGE